MIFKKVLFNDFDMMLLSSVRKRSKEMEKRKIKIKDIKKDRRKEKIGKIDESIEVEMKITRRCMFVNRK